MSVILAGVVATRRREHNERAWLAWHIAGLGRVKQFPRLKDMMQGGGAARRKQTSEEQVSIARQWTAALSNR